MLLGLDQDLAATEKDWIIAYWHHPPYTWGTHDSDQDYFLSNMRERVLPVLEAHGVDLVLCGHSHNYERTFLLNGHYGPSWTLQSSMILDSRRGDANDGPYQKPAGGIGANRGTVYAVCGCSGQGGLVEGYRLHPAMALNHGGLGSMILEIDGLRLRGRFLRPSSAVDDDFTIDKSLPTDLRPMLQIARGTNGPAISWPTSTPAFGLEWTENVGLPGWQVWTNSVSRFGRQNILLAQTNAAHRYFRLQSSP